MCVCLSIRALSYGGKLCWVYWKRINSIHAHTHTPLLCTTQPLLFGCVFHRHHRSSRAILCTVVVVVVLNNDVWKWRCCSVICAFHPTPRGGNNLVLGRLFPCARVCCVPCDLPTALAYIRDLPWPHTALSHREHQCLRMTIIIMPALFPSASLSRCVRYRLFWFYSFFLSFLNTHTPPRERLGALWSCAACSAILHASSLCMMVLYRVPLSFACVWRSRPRPVRSVCTREREGECAHRESSPSTSTK